MSWILTYFLVIKRNRPSQDRVGKGVTRLFTIQEPQYHQAGQADQKGAYQPGPVCARMLAGRIPGHPGSLALDQNRLLPVIQNGLPMTLGYSMHW